MAENTLLTKLADLEAKYNSLEQQISSPEVIADMKKFVQLNKEYKELLLAGGLRSGSQRL